MRCQPCQRQCRNVRPFRSVGASYGHSRLPEGNAPAVMAPRRSYRSRSGRRFCAAPASGLDAEAPVSLRK